MILSLCIAKRAHNMHARDLKLTYFVMNLESYEGGSVIKSYGVKNLYGVLGILRYLSDTYYFFIEFFSC